MTRSSAYVQAEYAPFKKQPCFLHISRRAMSNLCLGELSIGAFTLLAHLDTSNMKHLFTNHRTEAVLTPICLRCWSLGEDFCRSQEAERSDSAWRPIPCDLQGTDRHIFKAAEAGPSHQRAARPGDPPNFYLDTSISYCG